MSVYSPFNRLMQPLAREYFIDFLLLLLLLLLLFYLKFAASFLRLAGSFKMSVAWHHVPLDRGLKLSERKASNADYGVQMK